MQGRSPFHSYHATRALFSRTDAIPRTEADVDPSLAMKKRKLGPTQSFGSQLAKQQQPSFADVLERLREEGANGQAGTS